MLWGKCSSGKLFEGVNSLMTLSLVMGYSLEVMLKRDEV